MQKRIQFLLALLISTITNAQKPEVVVTTGHAEFIQNVAYNKDGSKIATLSLDKTIKIWETKSNKELRTLGPNDSRPNNLVFHPDKNLLLVKSDGGELNMWDLNTGKSLFQLKAQSHGSAIAFANEGKSFTYLGEDYKLHFANTMTGKDEKTTDLGIFMTASVTPDGKKVVLIDMDGKLHIKNSITGTDEGVIQAEKITMCDMAFSKKGTYMAVGMQKNHTIWVFNLKSKSVHARLNVHSSVIKHVTFTPDEKMLISCSHDQTVKGTNLKTKKEVYSFKPSMFGANCSVVHPKGHTVAVGAGYTLTFYDALKGTELKTIKSLASPVINMAYDQQGKYIASSHKDMNIKIWDIEQNKLDKVLPGFFPVAFNPKGSYLVCMGTAVTMSLYDMNSGLKIKDLPSTELIQNLSFSPDGNYLAGGGFGTGREAHVKIWDVEAGKLIRELKGHTGGIYGTSFHPDSKLLASCSMDNTVRVWDVEKGTEIKKIEGASIIASDVKFSDDGKWLAAASWDKKIRVYSTTDWSLSKTLEGHTNKVMSIDFDGTSKLLASCGGNSTVAVADNTVRIWDPVSGAEKCTMEGHTQDINKIIYDKSSGKVISGSRDATIRIWDPAKCEQVNTMLAMGRDDYVIVTPDNYYTASRDALSGVAFRIDNKLYPFEQFDLKLNRPDIIASRVGKTPQILVDAYHEAYKKRLKRMGFTEDQLGKDFHVPEIKILEESIPLVTKENQITFKVNASDDNYMIDRIIVSLNGVPMSGEKGISVKNLNKKSVDKSITLDLMAGSNQISVSCMNEKGIESLKESFDLIRQVEVEHHNLYLLEIDVSNYKDERFNLKYPSKDAKDFRMMIEQTKKLYDNIYELDLNDEKATLEGFEDAKKFLKDVKIDDVVIIYIVGHGVLDAKLDYYYGTYDIDFDDPSVRGLPYEAIERLLSSLKSVRKLLIMDTCHSGEVDKENTEVDDSGSKPEEKGKIKFRAAGVGVRTKPGIGLHNSFELMQHLFADLKNGSGATVISSAGGAEYAFEGDDWENGLFTYCLLHGTRDKKADLNWDGKVMISELKQYVYNEVVRLSNGKQKPTARKENLIVDFQIW